MQFRWFPSTGNCGDCNHLQAAIEAEEDEKRALKLKNRKEMEKMLAANQDLHERRAERISEELEVSLM